MQARHRAHPRRRPAAAAFAALETQEGGQWRRAPDSPDRRLRERQHPDRAPAQGRPSFPAHYKAAADGKGVTIRPPDKSSIWAFPHEKMENSACKAGSLPDKSRKFNLESASGLQQQPGPAGVKKSRHRKRSGHFSVKHIYYSDTVIQGAVQPIPGAWTVPAAPRSTPQKFLPFFCSILFLLW